MNPRTQLLAAIALAAAALVTSATGCELIAAVDREKISGSGGSTGGAGGSGGSTTTSSTTATGGTGGTMSTGGTGGATGGTGGSGPACAAGVMACTAPGDCPATGNECVDATCDMGCCGTKNKADMTPTATGQTADDCKVQVCDGMGQAKIVADSMDAPDPSDACHTVACVGQSAMESPAAAGTACAFNNGKVCDGNGACVGCLVDNDCASNPTNKICDTTAKICVPATCNDGVKNGSESDKDCGGSCAPCPNNGVCNMGSDCQSKVCTGNVCQAPTCVDGQKNGDETDTDCGGTCAASPTNKTCAVNQGCGVAGDCVTGACNGTLCVFKGAGLACNNNNECGAAGSNLCVDGVCCNTSCTTGCMACTAAKKGGGGDGVCGNVAASTDPDGDCTDQGLASCGDNGFCNGSGACAKYPVGSSCAASVCSGSTLTLQVCNAMNMCAAGTGAACPNGLKCASATACLTSCASDTDCASAGSFCQNPGPNGVCVTKKANGQVCAGDNQCQLDHCVDGVCCASTCTTTCQACNVAGSLGSCVNVPSGGTDSTCAAPNVCDQGQCVTCASDAQCTTPGLTHCKTATHTCVECTAGAQCASLVCDTAAGTCSTATCSDTVKNGTETGIDCGGGSCPTCANGQGCSGDGDCQSGSCQSMTCATINGCSLATATDLTGGAPVTITFDNGNLSYSPKCIKVTVGTVLTFQGAFASHPLLGGAVIGGAEVPASSGPFVPVTNSGATKNFTMSSAGTFPYYCVPHGTFGMNGAVFVVP